MTISALLLSNPAYSGPWQDMSIAWTHNPDQPIGEGANHSKAYLKDTTLLASGSDESFVGINKANQWTRQQLDSSTIPPALSTSHYIQFQFTTANTTDPIEVSGIYLPIHSIISGSDQVDQGRYKLSVSIDDNASFSSPTTLLNQVQLDDDDPTLGAASSWTEVKTDHTFTHNIYAANNVVSLLPNSTYTVRAYLYDVERNGSDIIYNFSDPLVWDDFGLTVRISTPPTNKCFAMADDAAELYSFDLDISTAPIMVPTSMIMNGEGATYRATDNAVYTFSQTTERD